MIQNTAKGMIRTILINIGDSIIDFSTKSANILTYTTLKLRGLLYGGVDIIGIVCGAILTVNDCNELIDKFKNYYKEN
jgi:hypothetical protein